MLSLDNSLFYFFFNIGQKLNANWFFIFLASYLPYFIIALFLYLIYSQKEIKKRFYFLGFCLLLIVLSRGVITETIRYFYPRLRPFLALNLSPMIVDNAPSFPSGHTTFLFSVALCAFLLSRKWGWILSAASLISVVSRIVAGIHWPSDILGGIIISGLVFVLLYYLLLPPSKILETESLQKEEEKESLNQTN
jgi:undecaprenyl-diphosphatase